MLGRDAARAAAGAGDLAAVPELLQNVFHRRLPEVSVSITG